jgi:hypothetical protein
VLVATQHKNGQQAVCHNAHASERVGGVCFLAARRRTPAQMFMFTIFARLLLNVNWTIPNVNSVCFRVQVFVIVLVFNCKTLLAR